MSGDLNTILYGHCVRQEEAQKIIESPGLEEHVEEGEGTDNT